MTHLRFVSLTAVLVLVAGVWAAPSGEGDLGEQKERQKQIQQETEKLLRRIETMIRVLEYNRLGASTQKAMLDEVSKTLAGVSREQMQALLAALENAGGAKGAARSGELKKANEHHERIVLELKGLLAKFDAVRSLDQAAERFEKLGVDQAEQTLSAIQLVVDAEAVQPTDRKRDPIPGRVQRAGSEQTFLSKDFATLVLQIIELRGKLPEEQKARAATLLDQVKAKKIAESSYRVIEIYRNSSYQQGRERGLASAVPPQWELSDQMIGLSRALRSSPEKVTVLRDSKRRLDKAIEDQVAVIKDTITPPKLEGGDVNQEAKIDPTRREEEEERARMANQRRFGGFGGFGGFDRRKGEEFLDPTNPAQVHGKQMGDRQGWLEFEMVYTRGSLAVHFVELAGKLETVEALMRDAQQGLRRQHKPQDVTPAQDEALEGLREVVREVDRLLIEEEKTRTDPLANLKDALARVEEIIKEQKDLREETEAATKRNQNEKLAKDAPKQGELARKTDAVRRDAKAAMEVTKQVLNNATREMKSAEKAMKAQDGKESTTKQDDALENLEEAKRQLEDQVKEAEKRKEEIAKLEEAKEKLAELIKQEKQIADKAESMADRPKPNESSKLARKQEEVVPLTKELGESLKESVPKAAKNVEEGAKSMESAKEKLDKAQPKQGEQKARDAVEKLNQAEKELDKELEKKMAEEAAAQAEMQRDRVDSRTAAEQIAKALEQAQRARDAADKAKSKADLAELQKQIGEKSPKANAEQAKRPAMDASEALKKGDFNKAMRQQKEALAQLEDAASKQGKQREKGDKGENGEESASELAQRQQELMDATEQMARSQRATQAAMSAVGQAQAKSPKAMQGQLNKANQQLADASKSLQKGQPGKAGEAQGKAAEELEQLLRSLNEATANAKDPGQDKGMGEGEGMGEGMGMGEGEGEGMEKGQGKGERQGKGEQQGRAEERENRGEGQRVPDGAENNDRGAKGDPDGKGGFINLPPRQREMLRQALTEKLPPEYAAMIQQYFVNIAKGKPPQAKK